MHAAWVFLVEFGFKVHRGLVAERAVEPRAVVKDFDPLEDGRLGFGACGKGAWMDQAAFEAAPEAFHHRIVVAVAPAAHAGNHARQRQSPPIIFTGILDAPVGMMHQPGRRLALGQGHVQRRQRQRRGQGRVEGPAHAAACATIQDSGDIEPAFVGRHIGDVRHPDGVRLQRRSAMSQQVGRDGQIMVAIGQAHGLEAPPLLVRQTHLPHQTANALPPAAMPPLPQPAQHARAAIFAATFPVRRHDQGRKLRIGLGAGARLAPDPGMVAATRDVQRPAQLGDGVFGLHRFYPFKPLPGGSEIMPKVFFRMSRCCATRCSSRWRRRFSAWSASSVPAT